MKEVFLTHAGFHAIQYQLTLLLRTESIGDGCEIDRGNKVISMNGPVLIAPVGEPTLVGIPKPSLADGTDERLPELACRAPIAAGLYRIAKDFLAGDPVCLILGDNLFYGNELAKSVRAASSRMQGGSVFGYYTSTP
ncbi:MAG: hypothetical protein V4710_05095, partial [Verrucomicrobiota bacterium]